ncbi:MAG: metallophosphoesterase [Kiritimatiellia bacterium]
MFYHLFFLVFPFFAWLIVLWFGVRPLRLPRAWAIAFAVLLFLASQKFVVYAVLGGDAFTPELPETFIHVTGWAYSSFMLFVGLVCTAAIVKGLAWFFLNPRQREAMRATQGIRRRQFVAGLAAAGTAGWGVWEGIRVPRIKRTEIEVEDLPRAFDGFRIVHLSDLHCSAAARREHMKGIVAQANTLNADIVCITGDFVDGSVEARREDLEPLKDLKSRLGVFGCAGNHDYYSGYRTWRPVFEELGISMLDNDHHVFVRGEARLVLGGIPDETACSPRYAGDSVTPDVVRAFEGAPEGCRILMKHRPIHLSEHERHGVRLQLSGHTHGGACRGMDLLVAKMGNEDHLRGLYREERIALYVNPGTGQWAGFPLRLGVPAEVSELILRTPKAK